MLKKNSKLKQLEKKLELLERLSKLLLEAHTREELAWYKTVIAEVQRMDRIHFK